MKSPFEVTEEDIERLPNYKLRPLLNQLLQAESHKYGIPPLCLELTEDDTTPDDGIDARISEPPQSAPVCRIPNGSSIWQYKAGPVGPSDVKKEMRKPGVIEAIQNGSTYCFVTGHHYNPKLKDKRKQAIDEVFSELGLTPKKEFFAASDIADWVGDFPVIATDLIGFRLNDDFLTFKRWDALPETRSNVEFQADNNRQEVIDSIREQVYSKTKTIDIRLLAADGLGKTRLILEAVRSSGMEHLAFYAPTPEAMPRDFFSFVGSRETIDKLILVVDECDPEAHKEFQRRTHGSGSKVVLITIWSDTLDTIGELSTNSFFYSIEKLDINAIEQIVREVAPSLHPEQIHYIAKVVGGNVKLATAMAEAISQNRNIASVAELIQLPTLSISDSLVTDSNERLTMRALSLFRYIGVDENVREEAEVVAKFLGLDIPVLKSVANKMKRRGLVIKRGRFRYVTPRILAIEFAHAVWEERSDDIIRDLIPKLPSFDSTIRLLKRLGDIGTEDFAVDIVEETFAQTSLDSLELDVNESHLLNIMTDAAPQACMRVISRVFLQASAERLTSFKNGRRELIYALEKLLRLESTFYDAGRVLLRLAEAENETWGNNATGIWQDIFQVRLGRGPLAAWDRHILIEEALESPSIETRILAVKALGRALALTEMGSYGHGPGGLITEQWRPTYYDEMWKSYRSALRLLDTTLEDPDTKVTNEAQHILLQKGRMLLTTPLAPEILDRFEKLQQKSLSDSDKKELLDSLQLILDSKNAVLTNEDRFKIETWCETLTGSTYHDRLTRWIGELSWKDRREVLEDSSKLQNIITELVIEGYDNPNYLNAEIEWLVSSRSRQPSTFALELGRLDQDKSWFSKIVRYSTQNGSVEFLSFYLVGCSETDLQFVDNQLENWVHNDPSMAFAALNTIRLLSGSAKYIDWLLSMIEREWLPLESLAHLWMNKWLKPLPDEIFLKLIEPLEARNEAKNTAIALDLINSWIDTHPNHDPRTARIIVDLLHRPPIDNENRNRGDSIWYTWQQIALFYVRQLPLEVTRAAINLMSIPIRYSPHGPKDMRLVLMMEALEINEDRVWPIIGQAILDGQTNIWPDTTVVSYRDVNTGDLINKVDLETILQWMNNHLPDAARRLAEYAVVETDPLPGLTRYLIINFSDDDAVRYHLKPHHRPTSWSGSYANRLQAMVDTIKQWYSDEHPVVQRWARELVVEIENMIRKESLHDEEDDLRWL